MKKLLLISLLIAAMPLAMMAQDDDLYFVPKKNKTVSTVEKMNESTYEAINGDTTKLDIIEFSGGKGIYPDSLAEDFELTKKMQRFDDYNLCDNAAFWAGYNAGRYDWAWHSPWYYRAYGWYDPWFYGSWFSTYYPWYNSWYYPYFYTWYDPWYFGYGGWYGWGWPYYYSYYYPRGYPYYFGGGGGSGHYYGHTGNAGTIDRRGSSHSPYYGGRGPIAGNSQRSASLRDRATRMSGGQVYSSGNNTRSRSGNFSGYRGNNSSSRGSFDSSRSSSRSTSSYSGGSSRGGSYSSGGGGSFGGGRSSGGGGGGGSRMGGRR